MKILETIYSCWIPEPAPTIANVICRPNSQTHPILVRALVNESFCYIQELRRSKNSLDGKEEDGSSDRRRDKAGGDGVEAYSGQKMKKAYYRAFWRAKCVKS